MSLMMKTVLIVYIMCMSYVIHVENSAIMDRIDFMEAINDNNERAQYGGQLFVQKRKDVHLVVRKPLNNNQHFIGRIIIPYIICFFAAKGFWPFFPSILQYQVNEMGKKVFSLSDDRIRQFCRGKFDFQETCYRPMIFRGLFIPLGAAHDYESFNCTFSSVLQPIVTITVPAPPPTTTTTSPPPTTKTTTTTTTTTTTQKDVEIIDPNKNCNCTTAKVASVDNSDKIETFDENESPTNIKIDIKNIFAFGPMSKGKNHTLHDDETH